MEKLTFTIELDMDFIPSEEIQKNIQLNIARILRDGGKNSGLVSSNLYPEDENETEKVIPFIDKLSVTGSPDEAGLQFCVSTDLTSA